MKKTVITAFAAVALCLSGLTACAGSSDSDGAVVVQYNPTVYSWIGIIAEKQGFFDANGVNAELKQIDNGTLATTALAGGDITLAFQDLSLVSAYLNKGQKFTAISGTGKLSWDVVAPKRGEAAAFPDSLKALEGKKIGVPALGSVAYYYARSYLQAAGVDPDSVEYVAVGPFSQVPSVISTGQVDAAVVTPDQTYQLEQAGTVNVLFSAAKDRDKLTPELAKVVSTPGAYYFSKTQWATENPDQVKKVQKSLAQAEVWSEDPANLASVTKILTDMKLVPQTFTDTASREAFVKNALPYMSAAASESDVQGYVDYWKSNGLLTADTSGKALLSPSTPADDTAVATLAGS